MDACTPVTLRPSRRITGVWSVVGLATTALATWSALDVGADVLAWSFAVLCLLPTSFVLLQWLWPSRFRVELGPSAIEVAMLWQHHRFAWDHIHRARVIRVAGEPLLEVHVWASDLVDEPPRGTGVLLPIGADLEALHRLLEQRLGRDD